MSYTETIKADTGDVMWAFDLGRSEDFPKFFERYKQDGFTLAFLDISSGRMRVEIAGVPIADMAECVRKVMATSSVASIALIRVDYLFKEYSIGMDMSKTRIQGAFKYVDGELVAVSRRG